MTHEYKVGDKVRMLGKYFSLYKGETYVVCGVDTTSHRRPLGVTAADGSGLWPPVEAFELVTEEVPQDNTDLTENRIPLGLLEPDVQERMKAWQYGWEVYLTDEGRWAPRGARPWPWQLGVVYRAIAAPTEPERVTRWSNVYLGETGAQNVSRKLADASAADNRTAVWRISFDKDTGLNPTIEVEQVSVLRPQENV